MEINITDKEVCNIILQKLKDKESLLITRIGDGEIVALKPLHIASHGAPKGRAYRACP